MTLFARALPEVFDPLRSRRMVFVDVGARGGLPSHWLPAAQFLEVLAFEPDPIEADRLRQQVIATGARCQVRAEALWESEGRHTLYVTRTPGNSSLFRPCVEFLRQFPRPERFDVVAEQPVDTSTLDRVVASANCTPRFAKIDAQGAALAILRGGTAAVAGLVGLELEVEFAQVYEGEPLFGDLDMALRAQGYELLDVRPTYWRRATAEAVAGTLGQLVFGDVLYMLSPQRLAERLERLSAADAMELARAVLLTCAVYGLHDWIVAYEDAGRRVNRPFPVHTVRRTRGFLSRLPFAHPLGLVVKDLGDGLLLSKNAWAHAEQRIAGKPRSRYLSRWR